MIETIGLIIFASLFIWSGITHIRNHQDMVNYTISAFGSCPLNRFFGFLGGWPTGLFLLAAGVGVILGSSTALYAVAAFLLVVNSLFHRAIKDPANLKGWALLGSALALATLV